MDTKSFRIALAKAGIFTFKAAAEAIGMTLSTFSRKVKNRSFSLAELQQMKQVFSIEDMDTVFFS